MSADEPVLLIGGNGFYGRALATHLIDQGRDVHVVSRNAEPNRLGNLHIHRASQDDPTTMRLLLEQCPIVVHLASTSTPGSSARDATHDTEFNVLPAARLLSIAAEIPPRRLLFVSSGGSVYGNPSKVPVDETAHIQPLSYHAAGKVALEALFQAFAHAHDTSLAILRPSNLYGPGQPLRQGFGLVRTLLERAMHNESVEVWGDGSALRDYLFIDDAVAASERLIKQPDATGVFNLGSGCGTSIRQMVDQVFQLTGRPPKVVHRGARETDVRAIVLNTQRLADATAWTPKIDLETGLERTWQWLCETSA
jgi:UDP-glucose 4-epimerase